MFPYHCYYPLYLFLPSLVYVTQVVVDPQGSNLDYEMTLQEDSSELKEKEDQLKELQSQVSSRNDQLTSTQQQLQQLQASYDVRTACRSA